MKSDDFTADVKDLIKEKITREARIRTLQDQKIQLDRMIAKESSRVILVNGILIGRGVRDPYGMYEDMEKEHRGK